MAAAAPDLVVVSGDFTQRARVAEFEAAASFLATLPRPLLAVPGNHDVPLYDVMRRWLSPLGRYRRYISSELEPFYQDPEIAVLGVNTARALTLKNGRINRLQIEAATERLAACGPGVTRVIVTHHPFEIPEPAPGAAASHTVLGRAELAMAAFLHAEVDLILSGHLHVGRTDHTAKRYPLPGRAALLDPGRHRDLDPAPRRGELLQRGARRATRSVGRGHGLASGPGTVRRPGDRALPGKPR